MERDYTQRESIRFITHPDWREGTIRGTEYLVSARDGVVRTVTLDANHPHTAEATRADLQRIGDKLRAQERAERRNTKNRLTKRAGTR